MSAPTKRELADLLRRAQPPVEVRLGQVLNALAWLFVATMLLSWAISRAVWP